MRCQLGLLAQLAVSKRTQAANEVHPACNPCYKTRPLLTRLTHASKSSKNDALITHLQKPRNSVQELTQLRGPKVLRVGCQQRMQVTPGGGGGQHSAHRLMLLSLHAWVRSPEDVSLLRNMSSQGGQH